MRPKPIIAFFLFTSISFCLLAQNKNPYQDIGKNAKVLTLSNGQYEELFDNDTIQQIGNVLVNINTMKVVKLLPDDLKNRLDNSTASRFLSVDPLTASYSMLTPYQYASNSPIAYIDLDGLEATIKEQDNVYFIKLKNVDISFIIRQSYQSFTQAAAANNSNLTDISVNTQQYEATNTGASMAYKWGPTSPQPSSDYRAQGFTVDMGSRVAGRSSPQTFYFSQSTANCSWTCGQGDVPQDSYIGFGGGVPVYVNGLKYGDKNVYSKNAPVGLPTTGDPGAENRKYLVQRSNSGYALQNDVNIGKTVIGFNDKTNEWIVVSQQDDVNGMSLDAIRDNLIAQGFTNILSFDGSTSATLVKDDKTLVNPSERKNNTISTGATFTVPNK